MTVSLFSTFDNFALIVKVTVKWLKSRFKQEIKSVSENYWKYYPKHVATVWNHKDCITYHISNLESLSSKSGFSAGYQQHRAWSRRSWPDRVRTIKVVVENRNQGVLMNFTLPRGGGWREGGTEREAVRIQLSAE